MWMHHILMEDNKPLIEHQTSLNPNMKDQVKKEILKMLIPTLSTLSLIINR